MHGLLTFTLGVTVALATLDAPRNLVAIAYRPHVVLSWTPRGAGATGFEIERALGDGEFTRLGATRRDTTTYTDRSTMPGRAYRYRVRAVAGQAHSAYSDELMVTVTPKSHGRSPTNEHGQTPRRP
jgi:hypothetical protein